MTDPNPLVAAPVDTATPFSGAGILDSGTQLAAAIESGDWVAGGLAAFGAALDTAATVSDPLGSLIAAGLGWLIDHFEPLKGWFNDLTGDAGEVQGFAQTWANVASQLQASGQELTRVVGDVDELAGEAIEAYRRFQADAAGHLNGAAEWAGAMSTGLSIASTIVQVVHDLVRDVISQLVGSAISWAAELVFSVGLATPWIIEQVTTRVASLAAKVGAKLTGLLRSVRALVALLEKLKALLSKADDLFRRVLTGAPARQSLRPLADLNAGASLKGLRSSVPGSSTAEALHYGSVPLDVQRAVLRHEYPGMLGINATRFDADLPGFSMNCTRCTVAFDQLMDGAQTAAMPVRSAAGAPISDITDALGSTGGFSRVADYSAVVRDMEALPDGSRGVVFIQRSDLSGHVFNVVKDGNGVAFLDAQSGTYARLEDVSTIALTVTKVGP